MRLCVLLILWHTLPLPAQTGFQIAQHFTQEDGLSHTAIYDLFEDSQGFLWIATQEGLNRFDGFHFKKWYHNKYDPNSLAHNSVNQIMEYQPGLLLIATANGLCVFNTGPGAFENSRVRHAALAPGAGANVSSLYRDDKGNIWVNQNGEIDILDGQLQFQYRLTDLEWALSLKGIQVAYESWIADRAGRIWLPSDNAGVQIIDIGNKKVYNRDHNPDAFPFMQFRHIRAIYLDEAQQVLYVAPWGSGLYRYDLVNHIELHQDFDQPLQEATSINTIVHLENNHLLCSSNAVFYVVNPVSLEAKAVEFPYQGAAKGQSRRVLPITIIRSSPNRYWIGANEGLLQLERDVRQSELSHMHLTGSAQCLDILVATSGEILGLFDKFQLVIADSLNLNVRAIHIPHREGDILTQFCEDAQQRIWIGSSRGVLLFDLKIKKFVQPPKAVEALESLFVHALYLDSDGDMWFGTRQPFGLYVWKTTEDRISEMRSAPLSRLAEVNEYARVSSFHEDAQHDLWMRSIVDAGMIRYDKQTDAWSLFPGHQARIDVLENKGLYAMVPGRDSKVWVSTTTGDGLIAYTTQTNSVMQFNREDGLLSDYIFDIAAYRDYLYLTSSYGYTRFNVVDHTMMSREWSNISGTFIMTLDTIRNHMVLGAEGKFIIVSLEADEESRGTPVPVIDGIYVNHKQLFINPKQTKLRFEADQKNVTIDFTSPYFASNDKLKFAYQLIGADKDWQYSRDSRSAQYAALSPGTYLFRMKAAGPSGHWGEPTDALTFTIVPPFWLRTWFIVLVILVVGSSVFVMVRRRFQSMRHESNLRQKIAETEMMALRAQMNPHFIFNCINSIDGLIMNDDKYQAIMYLNKFAKLIRNILDSSKQNTVPIEKDIETLQLYIELEQLRGENTFASHLNIDPAVLEKDIRVPPLIIQPYVENAILHGLKYRDDDAGKLEIRIARTSDGISYSIEDNGVGRQGNLQQQLNGKVSYGMQMSSDRIKLFNQEQQAAVCITDLQDHGHPSGTKVEIKLRIA